MQSAGSSWTDQGDDRAPTGHEVQRERESTGEEAVVGLAILFEGPLPLIGCAGCIDGDPARVIRPFARVFLPDPTPVSTAPDPPPAISDPEDSFSCFYFLERPPDRVTGRAERQSCQESTRPACQLGPHGALALAHSTAEGELFVGCLRRWRSTPGGRGSRALAERTAQPLPASRSV